MESEAKALSKFIEMLAYKAGLIGLTVKPTDEFHTGLVNVPVKYGSTCQNGKHERQERFFLTNSPALRVLYQQASFLDRDTIPKKACPMA